MTLLNLQQAVESYLAVKPGLDAAYFDSTHRSSLNFLGSKVYLRSNENGYYLSELNWFQIKLRDILHGLGLGFLGGYQDSYLPKASVLTGDLSSTDEKVRHLTLALARKLDPYFELPEVSETEVFAELGEEVVQESSEDSEVEDEANIAYSEEAEDASSLSEEEADLPLSDRVEAEPSGPVPFTVDPDGFGVWLRDDSEDDHDRLGSAIAWALAGDLHLLQDEDLDAIGQVLCEAIETRPIGTYQRFIMLSPEQKARFIQLLAYKPEAILPLWSQEMSASKGLNQLEETAFRDRVGAQLRLLSDSQFRVSIRDAKFWELMEVCKEQCAQHLSARQFSLLVDEFADYPSAQTCCSTLGKLIGLLPEDGELPAKVQMLGRLDRSVLQSEGVEPRIQLKRRQSRRIAARGHQA